MLWLALGMVRSVDESPIHDLVNNLDTLVKQVLSDVTPPSGRKEPLQQQVWQNYRNILEICRGDRLRSNDVAELRDELEKLADAVTEVTAAKKGRGWNQPLAAHAETSRQAGLSEGAIRRAVLTSVFKAVRNAASTSADYEIRALSRFQLGRWQNRLNLIEPFNLKRIQLTPDQRRVLSETHQRGLGERWATALANTPEMADEQLRIDGLPTKLSKVIRDASSQRFTAQTTNSAGFSRLVHVVEAAQKMGVEIEPLVIEAAKWVSVNVPQLPDRGGFMADALELAIGVDTDKAIEDSTSAMEPLVGALEQGRRYLELPPEPETFAPQM